jgi:tripeptide aminopeptidase
VRYLRTQHITPPCTLWFVATSREEGMGDLGGMKTAFARHATNTAAVINIEGQALGHVYNAGIAVRRLKIAASVEGGHSWLHFGRPSAIHSLGEIATKICSIRPPDIPRTTYNIGVIQGGTTINSIATHAEFWLDLRSESSTQLQALENQVRQEIAKCEREEVSLSIELVGDRPAGSIDKGHPLVVNALETLQLLGITPTLESASTDGNIPLAHGCPAVTIGITRGGNAHRTDEFIETEPVYLGLKQLILLTLTHAQHTAGVG